MNTQTIFMCVVALLIGMLVANMLQNVCGCNNKVEGFGIENAHGAIDKGQNPNSNEILVQIALHCRQVHRHCCQHEL